MYEYIALKYHKLFMLGVQMSESTTSWHGQLISMAHTMSRSGKNAKQECHLIKLLIHAQRYI